MKNNTTALGNVPEETVDKSRRSLLQTLGTVGILASIGGVTFQSLRSLVPNVLPEPPLRTKIGFPSQMPEGMSYFEAIRLFIFREGSTFHAISGACTHLGCTVNYAKLNRPKVIETSEGKKEFNYEFRCPCHGSKYYADGTNYEGPAPRPLKWFRLDLAPDDGQLVVDMNSEVGRNYRLTV